MSPPPQILGPVIEAIRYEPPETELDQMFSELLSASMDQTRLKDAHPAFPSIIRSLSSDEARLLRSIATPVHPESRYVTNLFEAGFNEARLPADLTYPDNCWAVYLPHLNQLGLIDFGITRPEPTLEGGIRMTGWGYHFMRAVTPPASAT